MGQVSTEYEYSREDSFSEAEFMLLKYQLDEDGFADLIRTATQLPPEKWAEANRHLAALVNEQ